ncbi:TPA: hypothetical protein ACH3X1_015085 [Trebouxia sp. C0004]
MCFHGCNPRARVVSCSLRYTTKSSLKYRTAHLGYVGDTDISVAYKFAINLAVLCDAHSLGASIVKDILSITRPLVNKLVIVQHEILCSGLLQDMSWEGSQRLTDTDPLADSQHPFNSFLACSVLSLTIPQK